MNTYRSIRRPILLAVATMAAAVSLAALAAPAGAAAPHRVDLLGFGTYQVTESGGVSVSGTATGKPFDGPYVGTLDAADGTLPAPGDCEPGVVALRYDGSRGRYLTLEATGNLCGKWTDATYRVTHAFTGRYVITSSSSRRLVGTEGFQQVLITDDGRSTVFSIDT